MLYNPQQVQTFGDISIGEGSAFTVNQIIQIAPSAIQTRRLNTASPYRGLKRFESQDKDLFFGRDQLIASLINAISLTNILLLLGASGSGKSSVVRAGLIPQISERLGAKFQEFTLTPDRNPFDSIRSSLVNKGYKQSEAELALQGESNTLDRVIRKLKNTDEQWLIFIDQFEEIFTLCQNLETRKNFIEGIVKVTQSKDKSVKILLAMRADFLDRFSPYPTLGKITQQNIHLITDMHPDELRLAIEQPAARHGVIFEAGLVEEIVKDLRGQAGYLPLLQYTLDLLWQNNDILDRILYTQTYRRLGGVRGALQRHVDEIYNKLNPEDKEIARQIFLRLVDLTKTTEKSEIVGRVVSRRAYLSEFNDSKIQEILKYFIDKNLLVSGYIQGLSQATIEITHEILIDSWQTLQKWIEESKEIIAIRNRLSEEAKRWQNSKSPDDELWSGSKLQWVKELREAKEFDRIGGLSEVEIQFVNRSLNKRQRQENARKILLAGIVGGIVSFLSFISIQQQRFQRRIEAVFLKINSEEVLQSLPALFEKAKTLENSRENLEKALAYYRQIIATTNKLLGQAPEELSDDLKSKRDEAEESLASVIEKYRIPELKDYLDQGQFGDFLSNQYTDLENQYSDGALKTTYKILMRDFGAGADLNSNGKLDKGEAEQIPCETLIRIQELWREKKENCIWSADYSQPECMEKIDDSDDKIRYPVTLTASIFDYPNSTKNTINRLINCSKK
jgi:energy-coupling factor transporter ATP-binding protein EcfA2